MADFVSLNDLIRSLEYGTKLHISVWYFDPVCHELLLPSPEHIMHSSPFCDAAKSRPGGYTRCTRCKKQANAKALRTRRPFEGYCIHGLYEACVPVEYEGRVVCVVYCGNAAPDPDLLRAKNANLAEEFLDTVDCTATPRDCRRMADAVAGYIRLLLSQLPPAAPDRSDYLIRNLKQYAESNYLYEIRLSDLAQIFHYNEKYIGRIFKKETGTSFRQYVNSLRLDHARKLLSTTDLSVLDISLRCGFNNVTYFNRVFKERFGRTPGQIRSDG